jgi:ABC-type lipoprotein release transport system permease subunit
LSASFFKISKIIFHGKNSFFFFLLTVAGLSFSIGVILCNLGLMDGYELALKKGLRNQSSDFEITSQSGFFDVEIVSKSLQKEPSVNNFTGVIKVEGFAIQDDKSKGVLINGIDTKTYNQVNPLRIQSIGNSDVVIGKELAQTLGVNVGGPIVLAFTRGNQNFSKLPYLKRMTVSQIIEHGVYVKDLRLVYVNKEFLTNFANTQSRVNTLLVKLKEGVSDEQIEVILKGLDLPIQFKAKPYWSEFNTLINAVSVEKFSITIILQLIIIISLFNIVAFVNFNTISKSQEFFLLRALGVSNKQLNFFWLLLILAIWALSCLGSLIMTFIFDRVILNLSFLKLPGKIYELGKLDLALDTQSVLLIFLLTFIWSFGVIGFILWKNRNKSIIAGMRHSYD